MMALSVWQPWAWLLAHGFKDVENRNWWTKFRGPFLIHASQTMDTITLAEIIRLYGVRGIGDVDAAQREIAAQRGGIVGQAVLADCVSRSASKWFQGKYGFVIDQARPLPFAPMRGRQGFFEAEYYEQRQLDF